MKKRVLYIMSLEVYVAFLTIRRLVTFKGSVVFRRYGASWGCVIHCEGRRWVPNYGLQLVLCMPAKHQVSIPTHQRECLCDRER